MLPKYFIHKNIDKVDTPLTRRVFNSGHTLLVNQSFTPPVLNLSPRSRFPLRELFIKKVQSIGYLIELYNRVFLVFSLRLIHTKLNFIVLFTYFIRRIGFRHPPLNNEMTQRSGSQYGCRFL